MQMPNPMRAHPILLPDGTAHTRTVFLREVITNPQFEVGAYTYASDFDTPEDWGSHLAPYLFPFSKERLRIGRFGQIAHGVRFITSSANHAMDGLTTFPFPIFDEQSRAGYKPDTRDTIIGHDVWLGYGALILPGAQIGNGAVIGAGAVVRGVVPDFAVVTGNPGKVDRLRFDAAQIDRLNRLAWWNWSAACIEKARQALMGCDMEALEACAP